MPNPVFNQKVMEQERALDSEPMTVNGAINKTFILFALLLAGSFVAWNAFAQGYADKSSMLMMVGAIGGFITAIAYIFTKNTALAWVYAVLEGLFLGGISAYFEKMYPGIAVQAIGGTFAALFSMLFLYRIGAIKCTEKFRSTILISTMSIMGIYLVEIIGAFFGMHIPAINTAGPIGIGFSLIVVAIASLNLIIDFDFIEQGAQRMMPKSFEWYGAFGLMVTLVWLYLEMLRLFAKLRDR
jgi:uncharacterized YccA/Bax inhibitor family protein